MSAPSSLLRLAAAAAALLLVASSLESQTPPGAVRGRVRSEHTGAPLSLARVEVVRAGPRLAVASDSSGAYLLRPVPAGRWVIRATHLGHAPLEVEVMVPAGREVQLDLSLAVAPVVLEPLRVETDPPLARLDTVPAPAAELGLVGTRALESTPGLAELGLADAARGTPPGQEPVDPSDILYVRGAAADLKLVYLDGAPVYAPFPLGGLLEAFTPNLLSSANVYVGGAPARYDGGLSYVLDLRTRGVRTDRAHSEGALDLLSGRVLAEAPLGARAGVLVSGRTVHGLGLREPLPYGYREGLARAQARMGETGALSLTGFHNEEDVWLEADEPGGDRVRWGNSAFSLGYRGLVLGEDAELTVAAGDFGATLPLRGTRPMLAEGAARRMRLSADLSRRLGGAAVHYGAAFDRLDQRYRARTPAEALAGREGLWTRAVGEVLGAYADAAWQVEPRLLLRGGLRADRFSLGPELVLAPRAAATWLVSERAALTLAAGRYHQYLRMPEEALLDASADSVPQTLTPLSVGRSGHLTLSLDQDLNDGMRLGVEGFFKSFEGMPGAAAQLANASGVDVWLRRTSEQWSGWFGYSLAWVWSETEGQGSTRFAGRHLLSAGLDMPLGEEGGLEVRFAYGAGLPYSAIPLTLDAHQDGIRLNSPGSASFETLSGSADAPPLLPSPDRPYVRLDLAARRTWEGRLLGVPTQISPYLRLLNTLGGRDALFYRYDDQDGEGLRPLAVLPIVPVVGVEWKF